MYAWLPDALSDDTEVVTANRRLARVLTTHYGELQVAAGRAAWRTPSITGWSDWLTRLLDGVAQDASLPTRLGPQQCQVLWERCIRGELRTPPANVQGLVRLAMDAWSRLQDWDVAFEACREAAYGPDQRMFCGAAARYRAILENNNWIDDAGRGGLLNDLVARQQLALPQRLVMAGFDRFVPQTERLIEAMARQGVEVICRPAGEPSTDLGIIGFENGDAELRAAGGWARQRLEENPAASVAIISGNLDEHAERVRRLVLEGLVPGWRFGDSRHKAALNVSYGRRLRDFPAVAIGLLALRWLVDDLASRDVSLLLRSAAVGSACGGGRARLELKLRELPDRGWSPALLLRALRANDDDQDAVDFLQRVRRVAERRRSMSGERTPGQWAQSFDEYLLELGWPGQGSPDSFEFQLINRWRELLNELARLELVRPSMKVREALGRLGALAGDTVFQPESEGAVVQLLGPLEAAGMEFDSLWISGLSASSWPPVGRPSALLSRKLQRDYGMPDAEPSDTAAFAQQVLTRLASSAGTVRCSYPRTDGDAEQTATTLLGDLPDTSGAGLRDAGWHASALLLHRRLIDASHDPIPAVHPGEVVAGGSATVQKQLSNPFAAFAAGRLGVRYLPVITTGLAANLRGNLIHDVLHALYQQCPSREEIASWSAAELGNRIAAAIDSAFERQERHADPVLQKLFALERERASRLVARVVELDRERSPFAIHGVEGAVDAEINGVKLILRYDRMDRMPDGDLVILDYKTGAFKKFLAADGHPRDFQLVVYACTLPKDVAGLGLVNIDSRQVLINGAGEPFGDEKDWHRRLGGWKAEVRNAASTPTRRLTTPGHWPCSVDSRSCDVTFDEQLLHADEQARQDALNVERSFIVQAPAGSGKTELLIQRYLKLLTIVDHPEEVLAITFTRKAAAEMQIRVLQALQGAANGVEPDEPHLQLTAGFAKDVLRRDRQLGWQLIGNPRRMRIQTLDSLNASIARSQPLSSPAGTPGGAIVLDAELKAVYRRAAAATLDWLTEAGDMHDATERVLLHVDNNTWLYVAYLSRMLETRDQWLPFVGSGLMSDEVAADLRRRFERSLENVVKAELRRAQAAFPRAMRDELIAHAAYAGANLGASDAPDDPISGLENLEELPDATLDAAPLWHGIAELLLTKKGDWRKTVTKNQGFPAGDAGQKKAFCSWLDALHDCDELRTRLHALRDLPPVAYSDEQWSILLALFRVLPLAVAELRRIFNEQGLTDHIEVALAASAALGTPDDPGDIALLLDYQVRHILVDEMQDTSSAQYRMLEALTAGWEPDDGRTLFCVGDPMQSIYRFRNAEVGQFLLARDKGIGGVALDSLLLRRNFRSGEFLVDWFNKVFPDVLPREDDPAQSAVSYSAAVAVPKYAAQGSVHTWPLFSSSNAAEAEVGLQIIRQTLDAHPDDDMAVLVRSRTQLPGLLSRLRKAGIPYRAVDIDRLTDLPEIIDVLALTRAAVHPGDRLAWLAVLRAPWVGLDWTDLHALVANEKASTVWELLNDTARVATLSRYGQGAVRRALPVLARLISCNRAESLRDRVEQAWLSLGGPSIVEDEHAIEHVYLFLDVVGKHEVAGSLPDVAELEDMLDLERVSNDVEARLQVMTMHRAKGLQFDHVLLYATGRIPGRSERAVLGWFDIPDEHGEEQKIISPVGPRKELENDPIHRYIERTDTAKDAFEQGRLLYVACTRARKSLHLTGNVRVAPDGSEFRPPPARSLLHLLWPNVRPTFEAAFDADALPPGDDGVDWYEPQLRRFDEPWVCPDAAAPPGEMPNEDTGEGTEVEFYWVGSAARFAGTVAHRWLQLAVQGRADLDTAVPSGVTERWLRELGVGDESLAQIRERVELALEGVRNDERGRWLIRGEGHAELALSGVYRGRVASVVLDRVRIDDDGTHWIVDYKTSTHEGGDLEGFLQAETERYRAQLARYAGIYGDYSGANVRCALYFPLLQAFVEVPL